MQLSSPADYFAALESVFAGMATLFLLSLLGWFAVRKRLVGDEGVTSLTRLLVDVVAPATIIIAFLEGLDIETIDQVAVVVLAMVVALLAGLVFGWLGTKLWRGGSAAEDRAVWALAASHNGVYLPLPLMLAIIPAEMRTQAVILVGGVFLVLATTQWTLVVYLLRGAAQREAASADWKAMLLAPFNMPVLGVLAGLALAFVPPLRDAARSGGGPIVLGVALDAARLLAGAMSPLAMIVLGMLIGQCRIRGRLRARTLAIVAGTRYLLVPLLFVWLLGWGPLSFASPLMALALVIQAAAPPGTNLSLISRRYGGDWETVSSVLLVTYAMALLLVPAWAALYMPGLEGPALEGPALGGPPVR